MLLAAMLGFCRVVIGLVFALSFASKIGDIRAFAQTLARFNLLPQQLILPAAMFFVVAELLVVMLMLVGGIALRHGFVLAFVLLLAFSLALSIGLRRKIRTSCNCFGANTKTISHFDVWRNTAFLLCTLVGFAVLCFSQSAQMTLDLGSWAMMSIAAAVFVAVCLQVGEIAYLIWQA